MNVISRGIRNAFRNVVRTFSIVIILGLSIGLSLVMLIAHQAVGNKIESVKHSLGNTVTIRPAGYSGFSEANNGLTVGQLDKVSKLAHVTKVVKTMNGNVTTTGSNSPKGPGGSTSGGGGARGETNLKSPVEVNKAGGPIMISNGSGEAPKDFSPPISVLGTTDPTGTISDLNAKVTLTSGRTIDGNKDSNDVLISESMAAKNNLKVGSTFTAYSATMTVVGIYKSDTQVGDNFIIMSLSALQRLSKNPGIVTAATATIDSITNIDSATDATKKSLGSSADVTNSKQTVENAIQPLQGILSVSFYSLIGAIAAGAAIILLTMVMIVRERKREIGILKAIGFSNLRIMMQFTSEALTLTILSAVAGLAIGITAGNPVTKTLVDSSVNNSGPGSSGPGMVHFVNNAVQGVSDIQAEIGWSIILYGLGAAVLIAVIGSALASYFIAKVRPAEVLRSE